MSSPERFDDEPSALGDLDGRRRRRERNRTAVVDAMLTLIAEGNLAPSTMEIAERAGSSARSLFRYFDDVDDLHRHAVERHLERVGGLLRVVCRPDAPIAERIEALVSSRLDFFDATGNVAVVARMRAPIVPVIREVLTDARARLRDDVRWLFERELDSMAPNRRDAVLAAIDALVAYEAIAHLRDGHGLDRETAHRVLVGAISILLAPVDATG